ncbi:hypothetical protein Tco_0645915 [Tanacetum coccineum]
MGVGVVYSGGWFGVSSVACVGLLGLLGLGCGEWRAGRFFTAFCVRSLVVPVVRRSELCGMEGVDRRRTDCVGSTLCGKLDVVWGLLGETDVGSLREEANKSVESGGGGDEEHHRRNGDEKKGRIEGTTRGKWGRWRCVLEGGLGGVVGMDCVWGRWVGRNRSVSGKIGVN